MLVLKNAFQYGMWKLSSEFIYTERFYMAQSVELYQSRNQIIITIFFYKVYSIQKRHENKVYQITPECS